MSIAFLNGKKVLFFGIGFYDYDQHITNKLEQSGAMVDYYIDYPVFNKFDYIKKKLFNGFESNVIKKYYKTIMSHLDKSYDYVLVIKGDNIPEWFISELKNNLIQCKFIMYQWDSIQRLKNYQNIFKYFDKVLTFDRIDALNNGLIFRPLFFKDLYLNTIKNDTKQYDLYFSGYLHSDRYELIAKMFKNNQDIKMYIYLYIRKIEFIKNKIIHLIKKKKYYNKKFISFVELQDCVNKKNMNSSMAILDIHHPMQTGLTIRSIEAIAMGNKLITTNKDIINYDFYDDRNIYIINRENPIIDNEFFNKESNVVTKDIINKYSLEAWITEVFCE